MQVYKITPTISYSSGCALVAATSIEEAIKEFCKDEYRDYRYDFYDCTCNIIVGLDYDTKEPCVIFDNLYSE